jgi:hypothetical protein
MVGAAEDDGRWGPTILLCAAVLLSAVLLVVAKPLTAGAASARTHAPRSSTPAQGTHQVSVVTPGVATSPNWSGYVAYATSVNDGSFNAVSASWTEPTVTCPKKDAWTLFWVGFDGWPASDRSVEQGGTSAQCFNGVPKYSAFYEMWPNFAVTPMFSIDAGDQISAGVVYAPDTQQFLITVTDARGGHVVQSLTEAESCPAGVACARTSAEWVAESPSHFGTDSWFPLADYGTMDFTSATATDARGDSGPIANPPAWNDSGIERIAGGRKALAKVSALQNSGVGSAFDDCFSAHRNGCPSLAGGGG